MRETVHHLFEHPITVSLPAASFRFLVLRQSVRCFHFHPTFPAAGRTIALAFDHFAGSVDSAPADSVAIGFDFVVPAVVDRIVATVFVVDLYFAFAGFVDFAAAVADSVFVAAAVFSIHPIFSSQSRN